MIARRAFDWSSGLQAFRPLHDSVRPGRTLASYTRQYTPCNLSAHNIISNFETDAQPLLDPSSLLSLRLRYRNTHNTNFEAKIATRLHYYAATTHHAYYIAQLVMTPQSLASSSAHECKETDTQDQ